MASLKELVAQVADKQGKPFDQMLKERIKSLFLVGRVAYLRRKFEQYGVQDNTIIKYRVEMISVNAIEDCGMEGNCTILRSKNRIPEPIFYRTDTPFVNVSSLDGVVVLIRTRFTEQKHTKFSRYIYQAMQYDYRDGYLYVYNNLNIKWIRLDSPFKDYIYSDDCSSPNCFDENAEFPLDADMVVALKNDIYKELSGIPMSDTTVQVTNEEA